jgi:hypothetical protein
MAGQMLDANPRSANDSPEWQSRRDKLTQTIHRQRAAMVASGQSTDEYDRNVASDVRRFLKAKGLTHAEIERRLNRAARLLKALSGEG